MHTVSIDQSDDQFRADCEDCDFLSPWSKDKDDAIVAKQDHEARSSNLWRYLSE